MANYVMMVVAKPDEKKNTVFVAQVSPVIGGAGPDSYFCGSCDEKLIDAVDPGQVQRIFIRCARCGSYNSVDTVSPRAS